MILINPLLSLSLSLFLFLPHSLSLSSLSLSPQVNGFEVYDPEEAVLLFLEQDQDITLTVARKIKVRYREPRRPHVRLCVHAHGNTCG